MSRKNQDLVPLHTPLGHLCDHLTISPMLGQNRIIKLKRSRSLPMDKLQLTGQNLGRVFNSRSSRVHAQQLHFSEMKQPNLKLKTRPKQLLGSLPLLIALPGLPFRGPFLEAGVGGGGSSSFTTMHPRLFPDLRCSEGFFFHRREPAL
jgi:hypothetical protein